MALLLLGPPSRSAVWQRIFQEAGEEIVVGEENVRNPSGITHIACWNPPDDLTAYPQLKTLISTGAGVDHMPSLPVGVSLSRTLASGIEDMVRDWVVMATLMLHRDMPAYLHQAVGELWVAQPVKPARQRRVGIMGMGRIGRLIAASLLQLNFSVSGWSRSGAPVKGVDVHAEEDLDMFLAGCGILVCVLPLTPLTTHILNRRLFENLPHGACLVHAGRGGHLDMAALEQALGSGRVSCAMLDVTDPEPLPPGHWLWKNERVIITPHIAAQTDPMEGAIHALNVIRADREGLEVPGLVPCSRGY